MRAFTITIFLWCCVITIRGSFEFGVHSLLDVIAMVEFTINKPKWLYLRLTCQKGREQGYTEDHNHSNDPLPFKIMFIYQIYW